MTTTTTDELHAAYLDATIEADRLDDDRRVAGIAIAIVACEHQWLPSQASAAEFKRLCAETEAARSIERAAYDAWVSARRQRP